MNKDDILVLCICLSFALMCVVLLIAVKHDLDLSDKEFKAYKTAMIQAGR